MGFLGERYDANDAGEGASFDPLPAGWYMARITDAPLKSTKSGDGSYVAVRYDIIGPSHEGRVVFGNLNIQNPNPKAEEIGKDQLRQILRAAGLPPIEDSDELIGATLQIKLSIRSDAQYGDRNEVKGFKPIDGSKPPAPAAKAAPAAAPKAAGSTPPWKK